MLPFRRGFITNVAALGAAAGGGGGGGTWNALDIDPSLTLSSGNLTVTPSLSSFRSVRSVTSHSTGKVCAGVTVSGTSSATVNTVVGIGTASATLSDYVGSDLNGYGWYNEDGHVLRGGSPLGAGAATWPNSAGQKNLICVDFGTLQVWFFNVVTGQWNADILANQNPATGAGGYPIAAGAYFVMASPNNSQPGSAVTADFAPTGLPAGFAAWG
jgi:hypothetical protein